MGATTVGRVQQARASAPRSANDIALALCEAREYTLRLYAHLDDSQQRFARLAIVNPPRWEIGHIGWFQEFWCRRYRADVAGGARAPSLLANADAWFDSGQVPHDTRWDLPLPGWDGIHAYLAATLDETLERLARSHDGERYFFELALYHEDMHGEALLMTLNTLALPFPPGLPPPRPVDASAAQGDAEVGGGWFRQGALRGEETRRFVFDNEQYAHDVWLEPFAISRRCVSNAEFSGFVDAKGYASLEYWSEAGRAWLAAASRTAPALWRRSRDGSWEARTFDGYAALDPGAPVHHINAFEAEAWCAWAGRRLPMEPEWEKAALEGLLATSGQNWEWTATAFNAYPGFEAGPYAEYSAPWFGDHRVLRGGSWATRPRLVHARFRNFYLPARHDSFAGFRSCALA